MHYKLLFLLLLMFHAGNIAAEDHKDYPLQCDTTAVVLQETKARKSLGQTLLAPFKWVAKNWSAIDPRYTTPSFYEWTVQLRNTTSAEWMSIDNGIVKVDMRSDVTNRMGPFFGWRWLIYGLTFDVSVSDPLYGKRSKTEFNFSINSNLFNIDLIHRRTGGDFNITKLDAEGYEEYNADVANNVNAGDNIKYKLDGININYFLNHKRYSNPAAFTDGAVQLRSVGSPVIGMGYTRQSLKSNLSNAFADYSAWRAGSSIETPNDFLIMLLSDPDNLSMYINGMPTNISIDDWHLQLGYAHNIVFSPRLMLALSFVSSPAYKVVRLDNRGSFMWDFAPEIVDFINVFVEDEDHKLVVSDLRYETKDKSLGLDFYARAGLKYSLNRWHVQLDANTSNFLYGKDEFNFNSNYGNLVFTVSYNFGKKREYRYDGKYRQAYIEAALSKHQREEMLDSLPKGNVGAPPTFIDQSSAVRPEGRSSEAEGARSAQGGKLGAQPTAAVMPPTDSKGKSAHYNKDVLDLDMNGCDLVMGPDGNYGTFEITDGYVPDGQDPDGYLRAGNKLKMDKDGNVVITAGHKKSIRAGNWWKSHLNVRQSPLNWYPEMLHYVLKGRLTCYVRSHSFGTMQPVKLVIDDFFICHGFETSQFFMIGAKRFASHSAYSITGDVPINGRMCRVYIESKHHGKKMNVYVNLSRSSTRQWMSHIPDNRSIARISLPGTHDSGSASLPENTLTSMGHTQNFTVTEQLFDGIRAFDIRLKSNMKYGHNLTCRDGFDESLVDIDKFLKDYPSEFIVALVGSDEGGKWDEEMTANYKALINKYPHLFVEDFSPSTPISDVRGKVLVIKRQEACPFGKLLKFEDNAVFSYDCFEVEDVYKEHKTNKKKALVEYNLRRAFENENPGKWFITFNTIAWSPRHHRPYYSAWGGLNIRKPMNIRLRELIEDKGYTNFGILFLDFYSDHGDKMQLVESIVKSNFGINTYDDYIPEQPADSE